MRIIAGKYRGRRLKSPPSLQTRPTSDRLRETLFNILAPRIAGTRFLDLCAGSGAVGIEALSRGAEQVTFVDQSKKMCALIQENLSAIKADQDHVDIVPAEASEFVRRQAKREEPFDIVFFDPPYNSDYKVVLTCIGDQAERFLSAEGMVVVEHSSRRIPDRQFGVLEKYRMVKQGDSSLSIYQHP